ncbi:MAG: ATP-binding cassette domain-containing protein [Chlamydiota bacterium]|nr:ATP-binding cassette domain-containing protein [Chlamydiota bacterium]
MIQVDKVSKQYDGKAVLKDLSLEIEEGETVVILGRSGAGKSVLLKLIMGLDTPDSGAISIDGEAVGKEGESHKRHRVGMLFQGSALFDSMTIGENVAFYLTEHGDREEGKPYPIGVIESMVEEALSIVELEGVANKMPGELSGGMRKRAALARLIVYRPDILLYDEPTSGLDPLTSRQINRVILKTQKELNATSLVVTHDLLSALAIGDRLALHQGGHLPYIDPPLAFLQHEDEMIRFLHSTLSIDPEKIGGHP